jgi:hypothetical protein
LIRIERRPLPTSLPLSLPPHFFLCLLLSVFIYILI